MKNPLIFRCYCLLFVLSFPFLGLAQAQFQREYTPGRAATVAIEPYGNTYFVATTTNVQTAGGLDGLLMKLNEAGTPLWSKKIGGTLDDQFQALQRTHDGHLILVGTTKSAVGIPSDSSNIYLVLVDSSGAVLQSTSMGTPHRDIGRSIRETPDNGFIVVGSTDSAGIISPYVVKTDAQLNVVWSRVYRNATYNCGIGTAIVPSAGGGYALTGYSFQSTSPATNTLFFLTLNSQGQPLVTKHFSFTDNVNYSDLCTFGQDIIQNTAGNYVLVGAAGGYYTMALQNIRTPLLMELSPNGTVVHCNSFFLNSGDCRSLSVQQTPDGGYVLGGYQGNYYLSMFKTNAAIVTEWSFFYSNTSFVPQATGNCVRNTPDGGYVLSGSLSSGTAMRIVKTDSSGHSGCDENLPSGQGASSPMGLAMTNPAWTSFAQADTVAATTTGGVFEAISTVICLAIAVDPPLSAASLMLYPNPSHSRLHIQSQGHEKLSIYNLLGAQLWSQDLPAIGPQDLQIDISDWASGVYLLRADGETRKFVKE